ncbi:MATE family efflux transporter [Engelhardtia mirabilis]|uniref:Multidrug-efflux transporter n=1 Tax=Engelhardtia mirabilis TaxID=2528011 RepID=A0A518BIG7_9BACT|nr:Multidrug resistance protein NorM [Planctomycetes bacterium Pla133]QDV01080.1 Multidrug resistance protein NorM [Planctomycetes bacterium Pla86]
MSTFRAELRTQVRLAGPVVLAQLGMMAMGTVDTVMVGHLPADGTARIALAAVGMGNVIFFAGASFAMGVLMSLDPVVSQALGARDRTAIGLGVQRGFVLAALLTLLVLAPVPFADRILALLDQPDEVVPVTSAYLRAIAPSVPLFLIFAVLRQSLQAMHVLRPMLIAIAIANVANVLFNWALIFGKFGLPALGAVGSGHATTLSRLVMVAALLVFSWPVLREHVRPWHRQALSLKPLLRMLKVGVPVGFQSSLEFWAFGMVTLLMGRLGSLEQAAHMVAIQLASISFMVPLGVSAAGAVRVGYNVGRGDPPAVRRSAAVSLLLGLLVMSFSAILFLLLPETLTGLFSNDEQIVALAASLLPLAAAFQLFDGTQVVALGCLRGVGDTMAPMVINLIGYWAVGFPVGYWLAFHGGAGPHGLWWGLVAGLATVAVVLALRVRSRLAGELRRIDLEGGSESEGYPG